MSLLISRLPLILYVLLATSAATVLLLLLFVLLRSWRRAKDVGSLAKAAGVITSIGTLLVSLVNLSKPLGVVEQPDEAKQTIERFYTAIEKGNLDSAYELIHRARIEKIRETNPTWGKEDFRKTYATTGIYRHKEINRATGYGDDSARIYNVSFDVSDELPLNRLYELRQALVKDVVSKVLINEDSLIALILENLNEFYDVPQSADQTIRQYVRNRKFESLIDPEFLSEIQRNFAQQYHIDLKPRTNRPSTKTIWRHFRQKLQMAQEDGSWKIRDGLAKPEAVANYSPGASP